ncbi:helix-turn-helix domain-containing protein [Dyadobacter sp. NIV53]|uniref:winged helix-turn-helix transcriptional regulator n=1 Tax=Dyadobacter sp. NIV53 TaxID=2861765 RepID=UPI001C877C82|nr:helix-turn-helix domain-containing protein [Dyadobacter sp. NIV53]
MKPVISRSDCPVSYSLDIFGDKWTLLILRDMMLDEKTSYSEFMTSQEKIASNILINRLNTLHSQGFVTKKASPLNKSKFLYTLTEKAIDLVPVIVDLIEWGEKYNKKGQPKSVLDKVLKNKPKAVKEIQDGLRKKRDQSELLA